MPIDAGDKAPSFTLRNQNNQPVSLGDFQGRRNVLLVFYPLAFTGTCQSELGAIQADIGSFNNDSVYTLTISVDSAYSHKIWADREGYTFGLLADFWPHGGVARDYGVFNEARGYANRGTFLVDKSGVVRFAELLDPGQARSADRWRAELAAVLAQDRLG